MPIGADLRMRLERDPASKALLGVGCFVVPGFNKPLENILDSKILMPLHTRKLRVALSFQARWRGASRSVLTE